MLVIGIDLSIRHWGMVIGDYKSGGSFDILSLVYSWDSKTYYGLVLPYPWRIMYTFNAEWFKNDSRPVALYKNASSIAFYIRKTISDKRRSGESVIVAIEDLAYRNSGPQLVESAEVAYRVRNDLYFNDCAIRFYDPLSVKIWAGSSKYKKEDMVKCATRSGIDFPKSLLHTKANPAGDVADAFFLMQMLANEIAAREDPLWVSKLRENQRMVFNRVTRYYPENILCRPFFAKEQPCFNG